MKSLLGWELRQRRLSVLAWSLGGSFYLLLVTSVYRSFLGSPSNGLSKSLEQLPQTVRSFISIGGDFTTPVGFLSSEPYYVLLPIILIALAISLGGSLLSREEREGTLELLLARPVSRGRLLLAKALSGFIILLAVDAVLALAIIIFTSLFNLDIPISYLLYAHLMLLLLAMIFGALAFAISAAGRAIHVSAVGLSAMLALAGYVLSSLESVVSWLRWPAKVLPYHYYQPSHILKGSLDRNVLLGYVIAIVALAVISWLGFRRRDIG